MHSTVQAHSTAQERQHKLDSAKIPTGDNLQDPRSLVLIMPRARMQNRSETTQRKSGYPGLYGTKQCGFGENKNLCKCLFVSYIVHLGGKKMSLTTLNKIYDKNKSPGEKHARYFSFVLSQKVSSSDASLLTLDSKKEQV